LVKVHDLFLRSFIAVFVVIFFIISVAVFFWAKSIYLKQSEQSIQSTLNAIHYSLDNLANIEQKLKTIQEKTNLRITLIDVRGKVIAETHKDKNSMENHATRKEIIDAKYDGFGKIVRYSSTINKDLLYVAKKINLDGNTYYLRIAQDVDKIKDNFVTLSAQIIAIFSLFIIAAFVISYLLSTKIQAETQIILKNLLNLTKKKKLINNYKSNISEFDAISTLLKKVATRIEKKEKIKAKHTEKLALSNKQKDEIISAISHEFKNPLAVIDGFTQTLLEDEDLPSSMRGKFLKKIEMSSQRMTMIINKLRLAIKLEESKEKLALVSVDLYPMIQNIASELEDKYNLRSVEVSGNKDITIEADETLLSMAIYNLVDNALKYSDDLVKIKIYNDGISVIDTGVGISPKNLEKITEKFYRVSENGWNNSLGLGLHIVYSIVNLHGFILDIQSIYHEGSSFTIKF
jgi:signal transduction histidine kinase